MNSKKSPKVFTRISEYRRWRNEKKNRSVGVVPTMGALHLGHARLLQVMRGEVEESVLTIFINPKQFGPGEDLSTYPASFEKDLLVARREEVDVIFAPSMDEIYPEGFSTFVNEIALSQVLCGAHRPGHFQGVTTVVMKLLQIIQPDRAYFGLKDAQQLLIINRMVIDLNVDVELIGVETVREPDGLAISSRNCYLTDSEREKASFIYHLLQEIAKKPTLDGIESAKNEFQCNGFQLQYLEWREMEHLSEISQSPSDHPSLIAAATYLGKTRLIDNLILNQDKIKSFRILK